MADNTESETRQVDMSGETFDEYEYLPPGASAGTKDVKYDITTCHVFDECWPMMIGDIELAYDSSEFATMNIVWQYRSWYMKPISRSERREREQYDNWRDAGSVLSLSRSQIGKGVSGTASVIGGHHAVAPDTDFSSQYGQ